MSVLICNSRRDGRKEGKLEVPLTGPCIISSITKKDLYRLHDMEQNQDLKVAVNEVQLKAVQSSDSVSSCY